jgi:FHS family glucose/mannose:H+ symporter-like MFS transporter
MNGTFELMAVTIAGAVAFGIILPLLSSIRVPLAKHLGLEENQMRSLILALEVGLIPMVFLGGLLVDQMGARSLLLAASLLTGASFLALARSRSFRAALLATLLAGAGSAWISVVAIVLMPHAFFLDNPAASENLGNVFFGLGALVTPVLADLLLRGLSFRRLLTVVGISSFVPGILALLPADGALNRFAGGELGPIVTNPLLWVAALVLLLYTLLEGALYTWAKNYLIEMGHREGRAALMVSGFWMTFLAGRLLASIAFQRGTLPTDASEPWFIIGLALLSAVVLGNMASIPNKNGAAFGLLLAGLLLGPIFPTLVGLLFQIFPEASYGSAYGAMFSLGTAGSLLPSALINRAAQQTSVRTALRILTLVALLLAGAALVLALIR